MHEFIEDLRVEQVAEKLRLFATEVHESSPLLARLATAASLDRALLPLLTRVRQGQPIAIMLFAAVHYLLLRHGEEVGVSPIFPSGSLSGEFRDPYPAFRAFCLDRAGDIRTLLVTRNVQTNEVGRCAPLLAGFAMFTRLLRRRPLAMVEIGASAGLNLLWDHYKYDFSDGRTWGNACSPVRLSCALRGGETPPLPVRPPDICARFGIDIFPIDVSDFDAILWLQAFVPWDQPARQERLRLAIDMSVRRPATLLRGDVMELLPSVLDRTPADASICLVDSHTTYQFSLSYLRGLACLISEYGTRRDVYWLSLEPQNDGNCTAKLGTSWLRLVSFKGGTRTDLDLGRCGNYGDWLWWSPRAVRPMQYGT